VPTDKVEPFADDTNLIASRKTIVASSYKANIDIISYTHSS
jgi:hypothetical protein